MYWIWYCGDGGGREDIPGYSDFFRTWSLNLTLCVVHNCSIAPSSFVTLSLSPCLDNIFCLLFFFTVFPVILLQCQLQSFVQLCDPMDYSTPGFPVLHYIWRLLSLMSIESVLPSNHIILCHPLLLLPSIFPSIRVFASESALHIRWTKY